VNCTGRKQLNISYSASQRLVNVFDMLTNLLHMFAASGWFLHLAFMDDIKGRFDELHNMAVSALEDTNAAELPGGKHLLQGDYKDPARALRR
jgi:hypothetical protein